jgi:hypothetical protein
MKLTHTGRVIGDGSSLYPSYNTDLRETKNFWVTKHGTKFRKSDGYPVGVQYPHTHLDLASVTSKA